MKFSANLGFLWTDRALPDAVRAAQAAGFDAVEFHWPYDTPLKDLQTALAGTGLPVLGLNTTRGAAGENGLSKSMQPLMANPRAIQLSAKLPPAQGLYPPGFLSWTSRTFLKHQHH